METIGNLKPDDQGNVEIPLSAFCMADAPHLRGQTVKMRLTMLEPAGPGRGAMFQLDRLPSQGQFMSPEEVKELLASRSSPASCLAARPAPSIPAPERPALQKPAPKPDSAAALAAEVARGKGEVEELERKLGQRLVARGQSEGVAKFAAGLRIPRAPAKPRAPVDSVSPSLRAFAGGLKIR